MSNAETGYPASRKAGDRKLGDEWADWNGTGSTREQASDEKATLFLILATIMLAVIAGLAAAGWYLIKPRAAQLHPDAPVFVEALGLGLASLFIIISLLESISLLRRKRSLLPYKWTEKLLFMLLPKAIRLGAALGKSKDRVGNSFIKVHNALIKNNINALDPERFLILLPRCLGKETRKQILSRTNGTSCKVVTAGGGEEAREAIGRYKPTLILALACERDLISGLRDVAEKVPVLAIPNRRPEGPCKNTLISLGEFDTMLQLISERKNR